MSESLGLALIEYREEWALRTDSRDGHKERREQHIDWNGTEFRDSQCSGKVSKISITFQVMTVSVSASCPAGHSWGYVGSLHDTEVRQVIRTVV